jgi:hypothetical protein
MAPYLSGRAHYELAEGHLSAGFPQRAKIV